MRKRWRLGRWALDRYWHAQCSFPPSENDPRRYDKIAELKDQLAIYTTKLRKCRYELTIRLHGRWLDANGKERKRDVANYDKYLIDAVRDVVGLDDRYFRRVVVEAVDWDGDEYAEITLTAL